MMRFLNGWLDAPLNPAGQSQALKRRGEFLMVLLAATVVLLLVVGAVTLGRMALGQDANGPSNLASTGLCLAVLAGLWAAHRAGHTRAAGYAFIIFLIVAISGLLPHDRLDRVLIAYALPTLAAAFVVGPESTFVVALLSVAGYSANYLLYTPALSYNYFSVLVVVVLAFCGWLVASRLERALAEVHASQAQYQALVEKLPVFVYLTEVGREGQWLYASPRLHDLLGFTPEQWLADPEIWYRQLHPDDAEHVAAAVAHSRATGAPIHVEYRLAHRDGHYVWVQDDATVIRLPDRLPRLQGVILDITERKQAEDALRRSEARVRALVAAIPDAMFRLNRAGAILDYWAARDALHLPAQAFAGRAVAQALGPDIGQQAAAAIEQALATGETQVFEYQLPVAEEVRDYEARVVASGDDEVLVIARNITARKRQEAQVQASLREKEVLLREIHHRVKNNLQVMVSLLSLQAEHLRDGPMLALLRESQDRIRSMALVHEELYQSPDLAEVDFAAYLDKLVTGLLHAYGAAGRVQARVDVGDVRLGVDTAIPCGLIVNELVANSLKYAFAPGGAGEVWVTLARQKGGWRMEVGDNGAGLPDSVDYRNTQTLGLQLVNILAAQVRGRLLHLPMPGTVFVIEFEGAKKRALPHAPG